MLKTLRFTWVLRVSPTLRTIRTGARMLVVEIRKPALPPEFANRYEFFEGGVTDFDLERPQRSVSLQ